jgi:glyoxylase-like metal-dependent hydrolase (beta-lactamase superfamily II)
VKVPDETFSDKKDVSMGNMKVELLHLGPAHSPGDMQVWLPEEKLVIAGDMAFHERLLPIFDDTDTASWVETWENEFEKLGARLRHPGPRPSDQHGTGAALHARLPGLSAWQDPRAH